MYYERSLKADEIFTDLSSEFTPPCYTARKQRPSDKRGEFDGSLEYSSLLKSKVQFETAFSRPLARFLLIYRVAQ